MKGVCVIHVLYLCADARHLSEETSAWSKVESSKTKVKNSVSYNEYVSDTFTLSIHDIFSI